MERSFPLTVSSSSQTADGANVAVVMSSQYAPLLKNSLALRLPGLSVHEASPEAPLEPGFGDGASLAVLEVDPDAPASLARLSGLHARRPAMPIVAAVRHAPLSLVRELLHEGVSDVLKLPPIPDELMRTVEEVLARSRESAAGRLAPMVAVAGATGGCGATSLATHLAAELALLSESHGVALVDLDLQFGNVADFLGTPGHSSILDLIDAGDRLDADLMRAVARPAASAVAVFAAPDEIRPLDNVSTERLMDVLTLLRRTYSHVVVDLPSYITNWGLSVAQGADAVLMVVETSIASLRQARRRLDLLLSVGVRAEHVYLVVNRVERRLFRTIGLDDVSRTLGLPVLGRVALETSAVSAAQDRGELMTGSRGNRFVTDIADIARRLEDIRQGTHHEFLANPHK